MMRRNKILQITLNINKKYFCPIISIYGPTVRSNSLLKKESHKDYWQTLLVNNSKYFHTEFYINFKKITMVFIKLTPEIWTLSGLEGLCQPQSVIKVDQLRYIKYQHFKSAAKKTQAQIHSLVKRENILSNLEMKKILKESQQTPRQKQQSQQLRARHELRMLSKYSKDTQSYYFEEKKDESIKDLSKSFSFGLTFIFSFFMAALTGYYFAIFFLGLQMVQALMVAIAFVIITIFIQTSLFIIKQNRQDEKQRRKKKRKQMTMSSGTPINYGTINQSEKSKKKKQ